MKRTHRYILLMLCLALFEGCAGKKCKKCQGGGGGGGGGRPPAGKGQGTHGPAGNDGKDNLEPAPAGGGKGDGPSNQNPFGSQFVPFDDNGASGGSFAPGFGGVPGTGGSATGTIPVETDPRNLPSFPPANTGPLPGIGGNAGTGSSPGGNFAPTSPFPSLVPGTAAGHPTGPSANERGPVPSFQPSVAPPTAPGSPLHSALGKCVACHKTKGPELSELLKDVDQLAGQFPTMPAKHLEDMIGRTAGRVTAVAVAVRIQA